MSSDTRITLTYDLTNCDTPNKYRYLDYDNILMPINANENCTFVENDTENYLQYENGTKLICNRYETVDNEIKKAKMQIKMLDTPTNATVHFVAYEKITPTEKISVVQNLISCTTNFTDNEVNANETFNVTITADSNYIFDVFPPTYKINDSATKIFTRIDDTQYTAEITAPNSGTITINATAEKTNYISVIQNLISCTTNFTKDKVQPKEELNIRLTPNNGYYFATIPIYKINNVEYEFSRLYDSKVYQAIITAPNNGEVIINANAEIDYSIIHLTNCTINFDNDLITVIANEGYYFDDKTPPYYTKDYIDDEYYFDKISNYKYQMPNISFTSIYAECLKEISPIPPSPSNAYAFCNIYLPTIDNLFELSGSRFYNSDNQKIDIFQYIFKCHKLFFNVNPEFETSITLANYRSNIYCNGTTQTFLNVNCGSVFIPEIYHNVFDYQFTTSRIYLPFIGFKEIDTPNIMNSNVTLTYKANVIDGTTLAIISTDLRGELYQFEGVASFDIPYMINQYKNSINHELYHTSAFLGSFTPSIQLITNKPYGVNNDNVFGYSVNQWCKIGNCNGYIKCADIQLILTKNFITNSEMELITTLLKEGVFV